MRKNIHKISLHKVSSKLLMGIFGGFLLVSCGTQVGGYSEKDGVYYDPDKDVLPENVVVNDETENEVGEYYDYEKSGDLIRKSNENVQQKERRYSRWGRNEERSSSSSSDWGDYDGTEVTYNDTWNMNYGFGFYNPYWGSSFGFWDWGTPWSWRGYAYRPYYNYAYYGGWGTFGFDPYWGYYSPYAYGYYAPYSYGGGYYSPYYGGGYYAPARYVKYRRSGANGRYSNGTTGKYQSQNSRYRNNSGFRTNKTRTYRRNSSVRRTNTRNSGYRSAPRVKSSNRRTYHRTPNRIQRSNSGGFRSGNSSSRSSGSSRSGRSGGFRR